MLARRWLAGAALALCVGCGNPAEFEWHEAAQEERGQPSPFAAQPEEPEPGAADQTAANPSAPGKSAPGETAPDRPAADKPADAPPKPKSIQLKMPGTSFAGPLPELTADEQTLAKMLRGDVEHLAGTIGERNPPRYPQMAAAADFLEAELRGAGYQPRRQTFQCKGKACDNLEAELPGSRQADQIVVVGAHYDTNPGTPGADDNGSGLAGLLALARRLAAARPERTLRFVAFANEEAPYFQTELMGSLVYARRCRERKENVVAMLSLETIGYYSDEPGSQKYPLPFNVFYPSTGNFIGFIGNLESGDLVKQVVAKFRASARFPSEGSALPDQFDGVGWSDHWAFWQAGYPAVMVTDTALFRNPHYHAAEDTPDKLDYDRMARVVGGLDHVVRDLAKAAAAQRE